MDYTGSNLTRTSPKQDQQTAAGVPRPDFTQKQYGFSLGGAIVPDKIHYYFAYEAKDNTDPRQFTLLNTTGIANANDLATLRAQEEGSATRTFKEDLVFGKIDWQLSDDQRLEVSAKYRKERDVGLPNDWTNSGINNTVTRSNDETRLDIKHELTRDNWLNEARIGYEKSAWNPYSTNNQDLIEYKTTNWSNIAWTGGAGNVQDKRQTGVLLQDDLTYTGYALHTVKTGAKLKMTEFDLSNIDNPTKHFARFIQPDGSVNQTLNPDVVFSVAQTGDRITYKNNQFGIYLQDDWQVNNRLEVNYGVRWDYEDNMLNNDYVMPADKAAALRGPDTRAGAAVGQTYAQSLAKGGINIEDYIANGNRKAFTGAIQPRLGFSYDLAGNKDSVFFSGWGRAYDRAIANLALDQVSKNRSTNEIWGINNNLKMPYADQFSIGLRQKLSDWNGEVAYTNSHQHNQLVFFEGNRDPNGGFGTSGPADPLWGSIGSFGNLVLGDFTGETRTRTLFLKADKPYSKISGWGVTVAYTNTLGETTNPEGGAADAYQWTSGPGGKFGGTVLHPSNDVERHRIIATGSVDIPYGLLLSGKLTWGSGMNYTIMTCAPACAWTSAAQDATRQVDVGLSKEVKMPGNSKIVVRADVINLFNTANWGYYGKFPWDADFQKPNDVSGPMRTIKLGLRYVF